MTSQYRLSGSRREAAEVLTVLRRTSDYDGGFAILRDHGEVFVGRDKASILRQVHKVWERVKSADAA